MNTEPRDFNELVRWATWQVIEGIANGKPLRDVMYGGLNSVLSIVAEWNKAKGIK